MPTESRDQRKQQRLDNARRWGHWLTTAMAKRQLEAKDIVAGFNGAIDKSAVSHWTNGETGASAESAIIVARILHYSPIDALRAAGHDTVAEAMMSPREVDLRARIADLDAQIDAKLDRLNAIRNAEGGEANGDRGAS